jgi:hypothetical protein
MDHGITDHITKQNNEDAAVSSSGDLVQPCSKQSSKPSSFKASTLKQCKSLHAAVV